MIVHKYSPLRDEVGVKKLIHCTACGLEAKVESCGNGPDNGLHLTGFFGYYGGFTDYTHPSLSDDSYITKEDEEEIQTHNNAWFCHDCCVKLFTTFPHLARAVGIRNDDPRQNMHHPCNDDVPCCKYAWKVERSPYIEDDFIQYYAVYDSTKKSLKWKQLQ